MNIIYFLEFIKYKFVKLHLDNTYFRVIIYITNHNIPLNDNNTNQIMQHLEWLLKENSKIDYDTFQYLFKYKLNNKREIKNYLKIINFFSYNYNLYPYSFHPNDFKKKIDIEEFLESNIDNLSSLYVHNDFVELLISSSNKKDFFHRLQLQIPYSKRLVDIILTKILDRKCKDFISIQLNLFNLFKIDPDACVKLFNLSLENQINYTHLRNFFNIISVLCIKKVTLKKSLLLDFFQQAKEIEIHNHKSLQMPIKDRLLYIRKDFVFPDQIHNIKMLKDFLNQVEIELGKVQHEFHEKQLKIKKIETHNDNFQIVVPLSINEIEKIGTELNNCLYKFGTSHYLFDCIYRDFAFFCIYQNNKLMYSVLINNQYQIVESGGDYNCPIPEDLNTIISQYLGQIKTI